MNEGQKVTYVGPPSDFVMPGDQGRLLAFASTTQAHVQVATGAVVLVEVEDLATPPRTATRDPLEDSLEFGGLSTFSVRQTYDSEGEVGVINAMANLGHLAGFSEIAEEAVMLIASRIRQDPSFREVLAHLDEEEGDSLLRLAAASLVRDAFHGDE